MDEEEWVEENFNGIKVYYGGNRAPVVRRVDNAIHWISHHPLDNSIGFASVYSPDNDLSSGYSVIHLLSNRSLKEHLVLIELKGVIDNEFLYNCKSANCRLLEIDSDQPVLQIGNYTFTGQFRESMGTHVLFEELESTDKEGTKKLKYKCNTTKILQMTRVFLTEKNKIEKGTKEVVGFVSDKEEKKAAEMDFG